MNPFRNTLILSAGDLAAKTLYFFAFVYLAQKLGVADYGQLEFAIAIRTYLVLLADAGMELWAIREAARGTDVRKLAARVVPARLALAALAVSLTAGYTWWGDRQLGQLLLVLTLPVLLQTFNLKWVFMGRERMKHVAAGLIAAQVGFALWVFAAVRGPADLMRAPWAFAASEGVAAVYFARLFVRHYGAPAMLPDWSGIREAMRPVLTLGAAQCLSLMSYNVDAILIGAMLGTGPVGLYAAAYKPVTAVLAAPISYFQGLYPSFARCFHEDKAAFGALVARSLRLTTIFAVPVGVGGMLLAGPVMTLLFGPSFAEAVPVLQVLAWSAVLVTLRGNFRHTLNATGHQRLDLVCAGTAAALNVGFNLVLIPRYGIVGAAWATVLSEICWFVLARYLFTRYVMAVRVLPAVWRPAIAGMGMAAVLVWGIGMPWMVRAAVAGVVYGGILAGLGEFRGKRARLGAA